MLPRSLRPLYSIAQACLLAARLTAAAQAGTAVDAWKIVPATAGPLPAVTTDPAGNTYGFTAKALTRTTPAGVTSTVALASVGLPSADGTAADFVFTDLVVDASGNVYAAETNQLRGDAGEPGELILKVGAAGVTTTTPVAVAATAALARPHCQLAVDEGGDVFTIAPDYSIRELRPDGQLLLVAAQAAFNHLDGQTGYPEDLAVIQGVVFTTGSIAAANYNGAIKVYAVAPTLPAGSAPAPGDQAEARPDGAAAVPSRTLRRTGPAATLTPTVLSLAPGGSLFALEDVETGDGILTRDVTVTGDQPSHVLIRAAGPGLAELGVEGVLARPVLSVYNAAGGLVARNSGGSSGDDADAIADAAVAAGTFAFAPGSADCALLLDLPPGAYTAEVTSVDGTTGIVIVEAYLVP
jgi:hypothetical protein